MNKFEKEVLEKLDKIISVIGEVEINGVDSKPSKSFEDHNFRVNSKGWKKITVDGKKYLENKTKDIWEILGDECKGEQLFTWEAAMRETKKAGKTIPSDEDFTEMLKTKDDMPNLVYPGYRYTDGFFDLGYNEFSWSSSVSGGSAWYRSLRIGEARVYRGTGSQSYGFSVRCVKD